MASKNSNAMNLNAASGIANWDGTSVMSTTALTQYYVLTGAGANTVNNVAPSSTSGIPLVSNGSSSQPSFTTAVVAGGGTGNATFTAYEVICGGTTTTGALQQVSGVGSSGQVLQSQGAGALPAWANAIKGSTSGSAVAAGYIGEYITGSQTTGTSLTNNTYAAPASITLSAGIWNISCTGEVNHTGIFTSTSIGISGSNSSFSLTQYIAYFNTYFGSINGGYSTITVSNYQVVISGSTTYYLGVNASFSTGSATAFGVISATRVG